MRRLLTKLRSLGLLRRLNPWLQRAGVTLVAEVDTQTGQTHAIYPMRFRRGRWFPQTPSTQETP